MTALQKPTLLRKKQAALAAIVVPRVGLEPRGFSFWEKETPAKEKLLLSCVILSPLCRLAR